LIALVELVKERRLSCQILDPEAIVVQIGSKRASEASSWIGAAAVFRFSDNLELQAASIYCWNPFET